MTQASRLRSVIAGGVLASALWLVGTIPAEGQAPTATTPAADQGGVQWGPTITEGSLTTPTDTTPSAPPRAHPKRAASAPKPPPSGDPARCRTTTTGADVEELPAPGDAEALERYQRERALPDLEAACPPRREKKPPARKRHRHATPPAGAPTPSAPGFMETLPGPSSATGVPDFVIDKFRVPVFLLPIYQAAGIQYGVRWEVLAAINEIETDYGRNLNISSAGALGWMQFMPSTWKQYGVDANKDGKRDPFNPVDAIFAAARYLKAAGFDKDARRAVFAYNHADWYVDSVMLRAKLIAGVPADLVGSLTGLTEGRFPIAARARYADGKRRRTDIFARQGSPVVAVQDGRVEKLGRSRKLGRYVVLQDAYGNRYTYAHLGSVARRYPVPKRDALGDPRSWARALKANEAEPDPRPTTAASAGRQPSRATRRRHAKADRAPAAKRRLFAHPYLAAARTHGGEDQMLAEQATAAVRYGDYFARPFGLDGKDGRLTRLKKGSQVIGGTVLGRVAGPSRRTGSHIDFRIRPAGKGAPTIDPKPILDGWKLLEATSIYRASGRNALRDGEGGYSIGQILLLPKPALEKRVLADPRVTIYPGGREDIRSGQIDRRVLATLEYLAESGMDPTVTALKGNHGYLTASGNVSEHSSGNAVDIGAINGVPILGHQDPGGITEQAVRRLMQLQGTMAPHQIISLLDLGQNTMSLPDHANHIHVGFHPGFGGGAGDRHAMAALRPGQWSDLLRQLGSIDQPTVPLRTSRYALPASKRASGRP